MDGVLKTIDMLGTTIMQLQAQLQQQTEIIETLRTHRCDDCAEKATGQIVVPDVEERDVS